MTSQLIGFSLLLADLCIYSQRQKRNAYPLYNAGEPRLLKDQLKYLAQRRRFLLGLPFEKKWCQTCVKCQGVMAQQVRPLPLILAFHVSVSSYLGCSTSHPSFPLTFSIAWEKHQRMSQLLGTLEPSWETRKQFQDTGWAIWAVSQRMEDNYALSSHLFL